MSVLLAALSGLMVGVVAYLAGPVAVAAVKGGQPAAVREHYHQTAMDLLGRAMLIKRKHSGWTLKRSSFDASVAKEKVRLGGETKHFEDPENLMSEFYGRPFAIAHESSQTITNPRFAELGEKLRNLHREGDLFVEHAGDVFVNGYVRLADDDDRLVNIDHSLALMSGDASPGTTDWSQTITELSQNPFKDSSAADYVGGLVALAVPFGLCWVATELGGGSGGGGGVNLPLMLDLAVMGL